MCMINTATNRNISHYYFSCNNQIQDLSILYSRLADLLNKTTNPKACSEIIHHLGNIMILTLEKLTSGENSAQFKELQQKIGITKEQLHEILSLLKEKNFVDYKSEKNQFLPSVITFNKREIEHFIYINS